MKKLMVVVPLCLLLLAGCEGGPSGEVSPPVSPPATAAVSDSPTPVQSEQPEQPEQPNVSAPPVQTEELTYEEYFSVLRTYPRLGDPVGTREAEEGCPIHYIAYPEGYSSLSYDGTTARVLDRKGQRVVIAEAEDFRCLLADEDWIYATENGETLFRITWQGENREDLLTDPELVGGISDRLTFLADGKVLVFLSGDSDSLALCRLYVPDHTLDVLKEDLPYDATLDAPRSNHEMLWFSSNPDYEALYATLRADPTSDVSQMDEDAARGAVELIGKTSYHLIHYYNSLTGEYDSALASGIYYRHPNPPEWAVN